MKETPVDVHLVSPSRVSIRKVSPPTHPSPTVLPQSPPPSSTSDAVIFEEPSGRDNNRCHLFSRGPVSPHFQLILKFLFRSALNWIFHVPSYGTFDWYARLAVVFIISKLLCCFYLLGDVLQVYKVGVKLGVQAGMHKIQYLISPPKLTVLCVISQYIAVNIAFDIFDCLADSIGHCFFDYIIDPVTKFLLHRPHQQAPKHRTHSPRGRPQVRSIPGRHNGSRARNKGRGAHKPPLRQCCQRQSRLHTPTPPSHGYATDEPKRSPPGRHGYATDEPKRRTPGKQRRYATRFLLHDFLDPSLLSSLSPSAPTGLFQSRSFDLPWDHPDLACTDSDISPPLTGWFHTRIQECLTSIQECTGRLREVIFNTVATKDLISSYQRRSEVNNNNDGTNQVENKKNNYFPLHTFVFMGKPIGRNNKHHVQFSPDVEQLITSKRAPINVTGEDSNTSFQDWLVGDSGAGCSVISNKKLLKNIRRHPDGRTMVIHCNSGTTKCNQVGTLDGFGTVWYNPSGIANIISLSEASSKHRITMDSSVDNAIYIHKENGTMR